MSQLLSQPSVLRVERELLLLEIQLQMLDHSKGQLRQWQRKADFVYELNLELE